MLAGAGLGGDARLAHALGQQRLAQACCSPCARRYDRGPRASSKSSRRRASPSDWRKETAASAVRRIRASSAPGRRGTSDRAAPACRPFPIRTAPASGSRRRSGRRIARNVRGYREDFAFAIKLLSLVGSLIPGADSTPLATSTAYGRSATAAPTLSGVRPPEMNTRRGRVVRVRRADAPGRCHRTVPDGRCRAAYSRARVTGSAASGASARRRNARITLTGHPLERALVFIAVELDHVEVEFAPSFLDIIARRR